MCADNKLNFRENPVCISLGENLKLMNSMQVQRSISSTTTMPWMSSIPLENPSVRLAEIKITKDRQEYD